MLVSDIWRGTTWLEGGIIGPLNMAKNGPLNMALPLNMAKNMALPPPELGLNQQTPQLI